MTSTTEKTEQPRKSLIPARMHDMPWVKFHWLVIFGLGTAWILDGLEAQVVAAGGFEKTLDMSAADVGLAGTVYLVGQVFGAVVFGRLTDTLGRKRLFTLTLAVYLVAAAAAGLAPNMFMFLIFRFISGMGIGGEYSAVNSAVDLRQDPLQIHSHNLQHPALEALRHVIPILLVHLAATSPQPGSP